MRQLSFENISKFLFACFLGFTGLNFGCLYIFIICVLLPIVFLTVKDDV